jgi:hypothetical protein
MKQEILIKFEEDGNFWRWQVYHDEKSTIGKAVTLEDAENNAFKFISEIKNTGMVHIKYEPGKTVLTKATGNMLEEFKSGKS